MSVLNSATGVTEVVVGASVVVVVVVVEAVVEVVTGTTTVTGTAGEGLNFLFIEMVGTGARVEVAGVETVTTPGVTGPPRVTAATTAKRAKN